ncbi:hypothetical protein HFN89_00210 [Rhizobium laguerreae]|nr:hypothetical protein [Rhizobium laguerreae]
MLFELPLVYRVTGVKRGNRRATGYNVVEMVEVDIAVVAEADAPVAVEWIGRVPEALEVKSALGYAAPGFSAVPPDGKLHTRLIDDRHLCPVVGIDMAGWTGPLVGPAILQKTRGVGVWRDIFNLKDLPSGPFRGVESLAKKGMVPVADVDETFESVETTTRTQALAALRQAVADCAFVGDTLYRVCSEPKIIFAHVNVRDRIGVWQKGCMPFVTCDPDHAARYLGTNLIGYQICDLKSWKSLVRKCNRLNQGFRDLFEPLYADRAPIVNAILDDPDYRLRKDVANKMKDLISKAGGIFLNKMSTDIVRAYCGVIDANAVIHDPDGLDVLENVLANFIDVAHSGNYTERSLSDMAVAIQEVLATRPVEVGVIVPRARR